LTDPRKTVTVLESDSKHVTNGHLAHRFVCDNSCEREFAEDILEITDVVVLDRGMSASTDTVQPFHTRRRRYVVELLVGVLEFMQYALFRRCQKVMLPVGSLCEKHPTSLRS
jgi:hypothetical protein